MKQRSPDTTFPRNAVLTPGSSNPTEHVKSFSATSVKIGEHEHVSGLLRRVERGKTPESCLRNWINLLARVDSPLSLCVSLRYPADSCQWIRTSPQNCWNWHVRHPHFGIFKLLFRKTHSLHEANLRSKKRGETNYTCPKNIHCVTPVLLFRKLIALVGSNAKGHGHPEPFDERFARMKSTWRPSFDLTADLRSFLRAKMRENLIQRRIS